MRRVIVAASLVLLLAGCGSSGRSADGGNSGLASRGYLSKSANGAAFIQLTVTGQSLSGTLDVAGLNGPDVKTQHGSFTGSENGQSLTLTFAQGLGFSTNMSGSVTNDGLTLNFPRSDGAIENMAFAPSDTGVYNAAVQQLQTSANDTRASQAAAARQVQLNAAVSRAAQATNGDLDQLQKASGFGDNSPANALQKQQTDLATMRTDEGKAKAESDKYARCSGAYTAQSDAYTVQSDFYTVQSNQYSATSIASTLQTDIDTLSSDFGSLQAALQAYPGYTGTVPTKQQVSAAIAPVQQAINDNVTASKDGLATAKSVSDAAMAEADAFVKQSCG
ncbi:hypothetical protein [Arthrobacter bambusae]|uniref:hypothetical protein n=1 Tax=Arthrobacter bambusae TaxID=1338426 RepID=UPI00277E37B1|nr:hypothetical protein [Arthrobacter bambusae]MDQ0030136.1 hypothetical protein [Arthrobacter bambusae]MDQ0097819.1 hypothetical protein [Arthrobacter bambusae]